MNDPGRKTIFWVMATLCFALLPQLARMPLPVLIVTLAPLVWRFGSELSNWKPPPAIVRHGATAAGLAVLFAVAHPVLPPLQMAVS